jgi:hypothetical protein
MISGTFSEDGFDDDWGVRGVKRGDDRMRTHIGGRQNRKCRIGKLLLQLCLRQKRQWVRPTREI